MLQNPRQIQVHSAAILEIQNSWKWDSKASVQSPAGGYVLWTVMSGEIHFQTTANEWRILQGDLFCFPTDRERFFGTGSIDSTVGYIHYSDTGETPRIPHRTWHPEDSSLIQKLFIRASNRFLKYQTWEATAALSVILDELFAPNTILPQTRPPMETPISMRNTRSLLETNNLHRETLTKLKEIDWSATQQLKAPPPRPA